MSDRSSLARPPHRHHGGDATGAAREHDGEREVLGGVDELTAAIDLAVAAFLGIPAAWFAAGQLSGPVAAGLLAVALFLAAGARWRLEIGAGGVALVRYRAWLLPISRQRFPLDATIGLYEAWESDGPEGLCVTPLSGRGLAESECFGPYFDEVRIREVHRAADAALRAERLRAAPRPPELRLPTFPGLADAVDDVERDGRGVALSARLVRDRVIDGLPIPAGSRLKLNGEAWLDPATPDRLVAIELSGPVPLPIGGAATPAGRPAARSGAILLLDGERITGARDPFDAPVELDGLVVASQGMLRWDRTGRLTALTLGAPLALGPLTLPAGSALSRWVAVDGPPPWYARPGEPLSLPELERPASLLLDPGLRRVVGAMVDDDVEVRGQRIAGGRLHLPLDRALRVDLAACRELDLIRR